jgi:hypothetical protein
MCMKYVKETARCECGVLDRGWGRGGAGDAHTLSLRAGANSLDPPPSPPPMAPPPRTYYCTNRVRAPPRACCFLRAFTNREVVDPGRAAAIPLGATPRGPARQRCPPGVRIRVGVLPAGVAPRRARPWRRGVLVAFGAATAFPGTVVGANRATRGRRGRMVRNWAR